MLLLLSFTCLAQVFTSAILGPQRHLEHLPGLASVQMNYHDARFDLELEFLSGYLRLLILKEPIYSIPGPAFAFFWPLLLPVRSSAITAIQ